MPFTLCGKIVQFLSNIQSSDFLITGFAVAFDGNDFWRVNRTHDIEVLALSTTRKSRSSSSRRTAMKM